MTKFQHYIHISAYQTIKTFIKDFIVNEVKYEVNSTVASHLHVPTSGLRA